MLKHRTLIRVVCCQPGRSFRYNRYCTMSDGQDDSWAAMADRVKASVPGTQQYEQQHGVDEWHALAEQAKSHLPGTEAHRRKAEGDPAYQTTGASGEDIGPVLPVIGPVGPYIKGAKEQLAAAVTGKPSQQEQEQEQQQPKQETAKQDEPKQMGGRAKESA